VGAIPKDLRRASFLFWAASSSSCADRIERTAGLIADCTCQRQLTQFVSCNLTFRLLLFSSVNGTGKPWIGCAPPKLFAFDRPDFRWGRGDFGAGAVVLDAKSTRRPSAMFSLSLLAMLRNVWESNSRR
jgi:hypothetical protein